MRNALILLALLGGCGRVGFDSSSAIGGGDGGAGGGDGGPFAGPTISTQSAYLKASNTDPGDALGFSLALSGDGMTLAVGANRESSRATGINGNQADNSATAAGAVYVFARSGTTWIQQAYLKASNTDANDLFGFSVAISADGNTLAVGAFGEASSATGINGNQASNAASQAGAVYVFSRSGMTWTQQAYLKASNTGAGDLFGSAVALSGDGTTLAVGAELEASAAIGIGGSQADNSAGDTLAVGAESESSGAVGVNGDGLDNNAYQSGAVYVFVRAGTSWSQEAYVKASNTGLGDEFGARVALSADGNVLAASAIAESSAATGIGGNQADDSKSSSGAAYVFGRAGTRWSQLAYVKASNTDAGDSFGTDLALSADAGIFAVSASGESSAATGVNGDQVSNAAQFSGAAYVFR